MQSLLVRRSALLAASVLGVASLALAQITVGPPGSGASYQQISAAVAAAPLGAKIFVQGGTYEPFVVSQSISIVRVGPAPCVISWPPGSTAAAIEVTQLPIGQTVRLSGLSLDPVSNSSAPRIHLHQCAGRVELLGVVSLPQSVSASNVDEAVLLVENCSAVLLQSCVLHGSWPPQQAQWQRASSGLEIHNSRIWCNACSIRGGHGWEGYGGDAIVALASSTVHLSRTAAIGGRGGAHFGFVWWDIYGYPGEEGIDLDNSEAVIAGGPDNLVEGGEGVLLSAIDWTSGGAAVRVRDNGTVRYAADVVLVPGLDGTGLTTMPAVLAVAPGATEVAEAAIRTTLALYPSAATPGQLLGISSAGNASATHAVFVAFAGIDPVMLPNVQSLHILPASAALVALTTLDATGLGSTPVQVPAVAALAGLELILQSVDVNLSTLRVSNPALLTIGQ